MSETDVKIKNGLCLLPETIETIRKRQSGEIQKVNSPWRDVNRIIPGFYGGDLVVIAGRPSMGKTAFVGNLAFSFATEDIPVLFFSLEMSAQQIMGRLLSSLSGIPTYRLQSDGTTEEIYKDLYKLKDTHGLGLSNFYVVDSATISAEGLYDIGINFLENELECDSMVVVVDYLQLMYMSGGSDVREKDVAACSAAAKRLARDSGAVVFLLSQLNRSVEHRSNKRPVLSDLRESGAIEQDADICMFLYRPDYYGRSDAVEGETEVIIAKHRNGPTGTARIYFDKERISFVNGNS